MHLQTLLERTTGDSKTWHLLMFFREEYRELDLGQPFLMGPSAVKLLDGITKRSPHVNARVFSSFKLNHCRSIRSKE